MGTRARSPASLRQELGLVVDPDSGLSLQHQIRHKLIDAMSRGVLRPGRRLPSSRRLSRQLGVSRNTVALAYEALLAAGHLVSRPRSGIFVAPSLQRERVTTGRRGLRPAAPDPEGRGSGHAAAGRFRRPPNWSQHPYPFLEGCSDPSLVPADEWREALRLAFGRRGVLEWGGAGPEFDDALLSQELRSGVLPVWGVEASAGELICTASQRQALNVVLDTLDLRHRTVAVDPGVAGDTRLRLQNLQAQLLPWDASAFSNPAARLPPGSVLLLSGRPGSAVPGREQARRLLEHTAAGDVQVIECVATPDIPGARRNPPSLRALDGRGCVILVGSLAGSVSLGTPPGLINADFSLIERLRQVRHASGAELAPGLQRAWAHFIGLGHYAAALARNATQLQKRSTALRDALNHYLHKLVTIDTAPGASGYSVVGGSGTSAEVLARAAAESGVLIEPGDDPQRPNVFSMGVSSLPLARIRDGVERLARVMRRDQTLGLRDLRAETAPRLQGRALERAMAGVTLLYNTVYGDPCTISVRADGTLEGRAGYADEDRDTGSWWVEGDRWFRQWRSWAYAEAAGFVTVVDGDQVRWFSKEGQLVDTALIVNAPRAGRRRPAA